MADRVAVLVALEALQDVGEARGERALDVLVQRRPAQVGGDQQRALAGLGERGAEPGGDGGLALGVQGARDQHEPRLVGRVGARSARDAASDW